MMRTPLICITNHSQVQAIVTRIAAERGIEVVRNADIRTVSTIDGDEYLVAEDGRKFRFDEAVWCTEVSCLLCRLPSLFFLIVEQTLNFKILLVIIFQAAAQSWVRESGLQTTDDGFICVTVTSPNSRLSSLRARNIMH